MSAHYLITVAYLIIATGFCSLYVILKNNIEYASKKERITCLVLASVFIGCGICYLLEINSPKSEFWWSWLIVAPLSVFCAALFNPLSVIYYEKDIKQYLDPMRAKMESDALLKLVKSDSQKILIAELIEDEIEFKILWYTDGFYNWANKFLDLPNGDLRGLNWYELANIPLEWKRQHLDIIKTQVGVRQRKFWKENNKIIDWSVTPEGKRLRISFGDETQYFAEIKKLKNLNQGLIKSIPSS